MILLDDFLPIACTINQTICYKSVILHSFLYINLSSLHNSFNVQRGIPVSSPFKCFYGVLMRKGFSKSHNHHPLKLFRTMNSTNSQ